MDYSYPLLCSCERNGDQVALLAFGESITYRELEERIAALTTGLREVVLVGSHVATVLQNDIDVVVVYMALARLGAICVPINTRLTAGEKRFILDDAGVDAMIVGSEYTSEACQLAREAKRVHAVIARGSYPNVIDLDDLARASPEAPATSGVFDETQPATIFYTSGTTGFPKGVVRTHRANIWNMVNSALGASRSPADVELFSLPAFGIGFLHFAMPALLGGATVILDGAFDAARVWRILSSKHVTKTFLAPTMIASMLSVPDHESFELRELDTIFTAYAFPQRLREQALARFGDRFIYMYGLTEAQLTCARNGEFAAKPSSVGRAMGVSRVGIFKKGRRLGRSEVGEVAFEGPSIMSGYHDRPESNAQTIRSGWVLTGDLGRIDEDGDLHYVGREKDIIKTGGFSVDPNEVINAILLRPEIDEVAVIGIEDDHWGERVVAVVSLRPSTALTAEDVLGICREKIAGYKIPKCVLFVDSIPKNATGKVDQRELRRLIAEPATH